MVNAVKGIKDGLDGLGELGGAIGKMFAPKKVRLAAADDIEKGIKRVARVEDGKVVQDAKGEVLTDPVVRGDWSGKNEYKGPVSATVGYITAGVRAPFEWAGRLVGFGSRKLAVAHLSNPYLTTGAVVAAGGAYGLNEWQKGQRQDALQTQAQVQQAMMQSQYMNSVSPQEAALLESRFRSGGVSMAEMEDQRRAAMQGQQATNV
ncbi:MAG: hypothetical protein ACOYJ2_08615 [Rickettsiales bacterium]